MDEANTADVCCLLLVVAVASSSICFLPLRAIFASYGGNAFVFPSGPDGGWFGVVFFSAWH